MFKRKRERHHCRWGADISDYSEYMITFHKLLHRLARSARLVAIIGRKKLQLTTINPPVSFTRLNTVSIPNFICRPSSLAEPEKGATIPKRISLSEMPRRPGVITSGAADFAGAAPKAP